MKEIYCWSRNRKVNVKISTPESKTKLKEIIKKKNNFLIHGNGRSYGDVCLNKNNLISMRNFKKILKFDKNKGELEAESGILMSELLPFIIKENFFIPVTAGTKYITLGGMVANNIHGKNVKNNYFSDYIISLELISNTGKSIKCSKKLNSKIFENTIGGIGLTGVIFSVKFKLKKIKSTKLIKKNIFFNNLKNVEVFDKISKGYDYSVSWLDSFSSPDSIRGIHFLTKHSKKKMYNYFNINKKKINIFHQMLFNFFNNYYFYRIVNICFILFHLINIKKYVSFHDFFYIQDKYIDWNKLYGKKGFIEFHILVPKKNAVNFLKKFFGFCSKNKVFSNLIVLKRLKSKKKNINFKGDGLSISCDFVINKNYNKIINFYLENAKKYGYIFYFAKDQIVSKKNYKFDKEFYEFKKKIKFINKKNKINSLLSNRIGLTT